uniref:(northern house mosquito) hypothetical protein n=1 Tax=Culex pipiens TaxID=7175 RepID=A0A8D8BR60_CULPI
MTTFLNFKIYFCFPFSTWKSGVLFRAVHSFLAASLFSGFSKKNHQQQQNTNCSAISSFVTQYRSQTARHNTTTPKFQFEPGVKKWIDLSWKCLRLRFTLSCRVNLLRTQTHRLARKQ